MRSSDRFASLFGESPARAAWDTIIARIDEFVVVPSKGSIVPNWLLVVPREPALNFAKLGPAGLKPSEVLSAVAAKLAIKRETLLWFEHGACVPGTTVGCGVDHAHLHLLVAPPFTMDEFRSETSAASRILWTHSPIDAAYSSLDGNESYYAFGDDSQAWFATNVNLGSQFFRRVIATLVGRPAEWDYKVHDGKANVLETLRLLAKEAA